LTAKEAKYLLEIIEKYASVWRWIEEYDTEKIEAKITIKERKKISYNEAKAAIEELYPSFEEKAATLLYLIIKNHSFVDGNKRIGAFLFLLYLYENISYDELFNKFNSNILTALCYLVATSPPEQKEQLVKLIMNFILFENC